MSFKAGFVAIIGRPNTGKSTLLRCINLLEKPTQGHVWIGGTEVTAPGCDLGKVRQKMGMVFQSFNLFGHLTVIENIMNPQITLLGRSRQEAYDKAMDLLNKVGLWAKALSYPDELSGGQQQRVAIARALVNRPPVLFADEPTGNLDSKTSVEVMKMFEELNGEGITIILVTHSAEVARCAKRTIQIRDGEIIRGIFGQEEEAS